MARNRVLENPGRPGWPDHHGRGRSASSTEALLKHILRGRMPNAMDGKMLAHWLKDPVYFGLAVAGYKRRWNSRALERLLVAGKRAA